STQKDRRLSTSTLASRFALLFLDTPLGIVQTSQQVEDYEPIATFVSIRLWNVVRNLAAHPHVLSVLALRHGDTEEVQRRLLFVVVLAVHRRRLLLCVLRKVEVY